MLIDMPDISKFNLKKIINHDMNFNIFDIFNKVGLSYLQSSKEMSSSSSNCSILSSTSKSKNDENNYYLNSENIGVEGITDESNVYYEDFSN